MVLIENDINTRPFSAQVLACLPPLPWTLSPEDLANPHRLDLRDVRVFSVDPPGNGLIKVLGLILIAINIHGLTQVARILMMLYIAHIFQMEIMKWESVSFLYCPGNGHLLLQVLHSHCFCK